MKTIDYNQVAQFEAATELINALRGILRSLINTNPTNAHLLKDRISELMKEKRTLRTGDARVQKIRDTYGPLVRKYYDKPKAFTLTKSFLNTRATDDR